MKDDIKKRSERRLEESVRLLLQTLTRNFYDTGVVLDEYEESHTEYELSQSKCYDALGAAHFDMKRSIERITEALNG